MTITAVIPIKQLAHAKQRLSGLLSEQERNDLFRAMVEDVLVVVEVCPLIDEILVVTSDAEVQDLALSFGAKIMAEPLNPGLIPAVTAAATRLGDNGADTLVFLPGDIPLVSPEELEVVLDEFGANDLPEFHIVPAADLGGSNCVACSPPDCMTFGFGEDSFRRHLRIAEDLGIVPTVTHLPGIGLDVDTPLDLEKMIEVLCTSEQQKATFKYLLGSGIVERINPELLRLNA
jgi:2-phospho-L-lactate guanylyltransferase